jgi:hypothetical protein
VVRGERFAVIDGHGELLTGALGFTEARSRIAPGSGHTVVPATEISS